MKLMKMSLHHLAFDTLSRIIFAHCFLYLIILEVVSVTNISKYPFAFHHHGSRKLSQVWRSSLFGLPTLRINPNPTESIESRNRSKRQEWGGTLGPVYDHSWSLTFGMGFDSKIREQFRREQEEYRIRNGGFFLPPSACPEHRPYIFYCDPRHRTGPINPVTGRPWPNGIYFPPSSPTTPSKISNRQLLLRPPCDSILCPVGGNEGYGYTGLEEPVGKTRQENSHEGNCTSLLCNLRIT